MSESRTGRPVSDASQTIEGADAPHEDRMGEGPTDQTLPSTSKRLDIQGLRAVAVLLVVVFHAGLPLPGGFIGVDVFFVISGFVIAGLLLRQLGEAGTYRLGTFYARRLRRLVPALSLLLLFVAVASMLLLSPVGAQSATGKTGFGASLFSANFTLGYQLNYFAIPPEFNALLHTWS